VPLVVEDPAVVVVLPSLEEEVEDLPFLEEEVVAVVLLVAVVEEEASRLELSQVAVVEGEA
jgi:hypothetical protein